MLQDMLDDRVASKRPENQWATHSPDKWGSHRTRHSDNMKQNGKFLSWCQNGNITQKWQF